MIEKKTTGANGVVILQEEMGYDSVGNKTFNTTSWDGPTTDVTRSDLYRLDNGSQVVGVRYGAPSVRSNFDQIGNDNKPRPPTPGGYDAASAWAREEAWKFDALGNREWMTVRENAGGAVTSATTRYTWQGCPACVFRGCIVNCIA